jgi:hypothetical protein
MAEPKKMPEVNLVAVHTVGLGGKFIAPGMVFSAPKSAADELVALGAATLVAASVQAAE